MKDLTHSSPAKVKASLERAKKHGDETWIRPLLEAFAGRPEDGLREEMRTLLSTLKLSAAEEVFLQALQEEAFATIQADILGFLWSCGFTCEGNLSLVAEVACQGDFRQAMEGATLLEQVESTAHEKDVLEALVATGEALQDDSKEDIWPFLEAMRRHLTMLSDDLT
jgi:N-acetylglutamate synthase-like GNAT family acetyltransferase